MVARRGKRRGRLRRRDMSPPSGQALEQRDEAKGGGDAEGGNEADVVTRRAHGHGGLEKQHEQRRGGENGKIETATAELGGGRADEHREGEEAEILAEPQAAPGQHNRDKNE